jgi:DNA-binding HxlR family transcriptional regulator
MEPRSGGPVAAAIEALGDRWTLSILSDIVFGDHRHFRALLNASTEGIATNILADRLVKLVESGLITRGTTMRGQRARYSLTEAGIQTLPILQALGAWGAQWRPGSGAPEPLTMDELRARHLPPG